MKTFQQFNETMMMPLRTTEVTSNRADGSKKYEFTYAGRKYTIEIVYVEKVKGGLIGNVDFAMGKKYEPTGKNSGQFHILSTVIKAMDDAFTTGGYVQLNFLAVNKMRDLYQRLADTLKGTKYHVERNKLLPNADQFLVVKK